MRLLIGKKHSEWYGATLHTIRYCPEWQPKSSPVPVAEKLTYSTLSNSKFGYDGEVKYYSLEMAPKDLIERFEKMKNV